MPIYIRILVVYLIPCLDSVFWFRVLTHCTRGQQSQVRPPLNA